MADFPVAFRTIQGGSDAEHKTIHPCAIQFVALLLLSMPCAGYPVAIPCCAVHEVQAGVIEVSVGRAALPLSQNAERRDPSVPPFEPVARCTSRDDDLWFGKISPRPHPYRGKARVRSENAPRPVMRAAIASASPMATVPDA